MNQSDQLRSSQAPDGFCCWWTSPAHSHECGQCVNPSDPHGCGGSGCQPTNCDGSPRGGGADAFWCPSSGSSSTLRETATNQSDQLRSAQAPDGFCCWWTSPAHSHECGQCVNPSDSHGCGGSGCQPTDCDGSPGGGGADAFWCPSSGSSSTLRETATNQSDQLRSAQAPDGFCCWWTSPAHSHECGQCV